MAEDTAPDAPAKTLARPAAPGSLPEGQYSRRDFLNLVGWAWLSAALGGWALAAVRFLFPNMLYEPNPVFKIGWPKDYPLLGGLTTVYIGLQTKFRIWVVTQADGIFVFHAKCTHLGCTPRWVPDDRRFECPCHGSNFDVEGNVVAGPAPEPLFRCRVSMSQDGQIQVDKAVLTNNPSQIHADQFFLKKNLWS